MVRNPPSVGEAQEEQDRLTRRIRAADESLANSPDTALIDGTFTAMNAR